MALYTKKKLIEKIQTYWPEDNRQEIIDLLDQYGVESYEKEVTRVQLAILKLCQGDRSQLQTLVKTAKTDYRDILAWAEYPEELKFGFIELKKMPAEEVKKIRQRDREQFLQWLNE